MILSLVDEVREQLEERDRLERQQDEVEQVRATHEALQKVLERAKDLRALCELTRRRLAPERPFVRARLGELRGEVVTSQGAFAQARDQHTQLNTIEKRLGDLEEHLDRSWQQYANQVVGPQADLFTLVQSLPEIQAQASEIGTLLAHLNRLAKRAPRTSRELNLFNEQLERLTATLSRLEGLSEEVKAFLERVASGQATVADLSDEVLQWCRRGERARVFHLSFTRPSGRL